MNAELAIETIEHAYLNEQLQVLFFIMIFVFQINIKKDILFLIYIPRFFINYINHGIVFYLE